MDIEKIIKKCKENNTLPWDLLSEVYGQYNELHGMLSNDEHKFILNYDDYNKLEELILKIYYFDKDIDFIEIPKAIMVCIDKSKMLGKAISEMCKSWYNKENNYNYDNIIIIWAENDKKYNFKENIERIFMYGIANNY